MRIGIDGRELAKRNITGIARYLRNFLISDAREKSPHTFIIYGNQHTSVDLSGANVEVKVITERLTPWWDQVVLSKCARTDHLDLFFSPYDKGPLFLPCPLVLTVHDLLFTVIPDRRGMGGFLYYRAYIETRKLMAKRADLIITVSEHSKRDIVRLFGVRESKIKVVPNGVPDKYHHTQDRSTIERTRRKYGIPGDYILYVGNFKPHKNVRCLVEAYNGLSDLLKDTYYLVLCGRRDRFRDEIEAWVKNLGLERRVIFVDFVSEDDMPNLYSGAEVFVFPSLYEGFGLPPLEAMACGTPVICSNRTSLPEIVGDAGVLVDASRPEPLTEAIDRILTDREFRDDLGLKGLHRSRQFSVEVVSKRLLEVIESVCVGS